MDCQSPQFWTVDLKKINSHSFELIFKFLNQIFVKNIDQKQDHDLYASCLILENKGYLKWDFQKFSFMSFEKDIDFQKMLESQIIFTS